MACDALYVHGMLCTLVLRITVADLSLLQTTRDSAGIENFSAL